MTAAVDDLLETIARRAEEEAKDYGAGSEGGHALRAFAAEIRAAKPCNNPSWARDVPMPRPPVR